MSVYDIPVLFQVNAGDELGAAQTVVSILEDLSIIGRGINIRPAETKIESWHLPNHKNADGSNEPVRVLIIPLVSPLREKP